MKYLPWLIFMFISVHCTNTQYKEVEKNGTVNWQDSVTQLYEKHQLMGLQTLLIQNDQVIFESNFGLQNWALKDSVDGETVFRIASISKLITTLAVMRLVDQKKLDLDTDVSEYLGWKLRNPNFPEHTITLRLLMSHVSGFRDGKGYSAFVDHMIRKKLNIKELFTEQGEYYTEDMVSEQAPGTYFSYTNSTWGIIASVVEKVGQKKFDTICREEVFIPLGMNRSSFNVMDIDPTHLAALYTADSGKWVSQVDDISKGSLKDRAWEDYEPGTNGLLYGPQGSLRTNANDLLQVMQLFFNQGTVNSSTYLSDTTMALLSHKEWVYDGNNGDTWNKFWHAYSLGTHHIENRKQGDIIFPEITMMGHPGIAYGLLSDLYFDPNTKTGVIFITNGSQKKYEYATTSSFYEVEDDLFKLYRQILHSINE